MQIIACAALLLGAKVEETPQRFQQILQMATHIRFAGQAVNLQRAMVGQQHTFLRGISGTLPWQYWKILTHCRQRYLICCLNTSSVSAGTDRRAAGSGQQSREVYSIHHRL